MTSKPRCSLYLISPPQFELSEFTEKLKDAFAGGEIAAFQLRMKGVDDEDIILASRQLMPICHHHNTQFILNDRPDLAFKINADGVHIGDDDAEYKKARDIMGKNKVIGVSCYGSTDHAMTVGNAGADYVSFGAFFPTHTKKAKAHPAPDILKWWSNYSNVPCVAIGGITPQNCGELARQGADFIAAISAIWNHPHSPKYAVHDMLKQIHKNLEQF